MTLHPISLVDNVLDKHRRRFRMEYHLECFRDDLASDYDLDDK